MHTLETNGNGHPGEGQARPPPSTAGELRAKARQLNRQAEELRTEAARLVVEATRREAQFRGLEMDLDAAMASAVRDAGDPLTPRTWCRCALTLIRGRPADTPDQNNLELLLTYFIAMDPPADCFADLLAGYLDQLSPGGAEAALLLHRSWLRWHHGGARRPPFQETLRTLGALLDNAGARAALLIVAPDGVAQQTFRELGQRYLEPPELEEQIASRIALRGKTEPSTRAPVDRYEALLRVLGAALDVEADPTEPYELVVTPRGVTVVDSAGYYQVFTVEQLLALLRASGYERHLRGAGNGL